MSTVVVKVGSSSLSNTRGGLDREKLQHIVDELAGLVQTGRQVALVSSGAVAAGFERIGFRRRPRDIAEKQAAAAVGQGLLIEEYTHRLLQKGITAAQVLLTKEDFTDRRRYVNASRALSLLLRRGVLPVINENDTVSVEELTFGDNDRLSAWVASLLQADQLILLSDVDGLYDADPRTMPGARLIPDVPAITPEIEALARGAGSDLGTGGMQSKIEAAKIATESGIPVYLGNAQQKGLLVDSVLGQAVGTYFAASSGPLPGRKQWLKFMSEPQGRLIVDEGAVAALLTQGSSLLASGVTEVEGAFYAGAVVEVISPQGEKVAKGFSHYSSEQLKKMKGMRSGEIYRRFEIAPEAVIHRNNLAIIDDMKEYVK